MEQIYNEKMSSLGYSHHIVDIFNDWEDVKDELLVPERKTGFGNGTIHVYLGAGDIELRKEFNNYYSSVEGGEDPASGAYPIKHFFLRSNIISMVGHACVYEFLHQNSPDSFVVEMFASLEKEESIQGLIQTSSLFKLSLSVRSSTPRPYFKSFDSNGAFSKIVRKILLPKSSYKISLYKNEKGEYAAFWLLGFAGQSSFEANPITEKRIQNSSASLQKIFFGTPGSGKSHVVKELTEGKKVHRTTFHPDSDYASFVGCYKPTMNQQSKQVLTEDELKQKLQEYLEDGASYPVHRFAAAYPEIEEVQSSIRKEWLTSFGKTDSMDVEISEGVACAKEMRRFINSSQISYSFTPQVFTEAYIDAWTNLEEEVCLVIEEINRGNCAQIFGDLFQLLDRKADGYSDYRITADSDLRDHLVRRLGPDHEGIKKGKLCLPPNLRIFATMNTSDQSLFPMDSAFKRRWDWEYVPIDYSNEIESGRFSITLDKKRYSWIKFLEEVNKRILKTTDSEDKQMGNFFIRSDISEDVFKSKVMFYLWNEVCRDEYRTQNNFFRCKQNDKETEFSFNDLYQTNGLEQLLGFMAYLGVSPLPTNEDGNEEVGETEEA